MLRLVQYIVDGYIVFLFMVGLILFSLIKQGKRSRRKALATGIMIASTVPVWIVCYLITTDRLPLYALGLVLLAVSALLAALRRIVFPYHTTCRNCGTKLSITEFLASDDNLCQACYEQKYPERVPRSREDIIAEENARKKETWTGWKYNRECAVVFAYNVETDEVLLVERLNMGKVSGKHTGGMAYVKAGENPSYAAERALRAETGLRCTDPDLEGYLNFEMADYNLRCYVYVARNYSGETRQTETNNPFWVRVRKMKYNLMSMDYTVWLERALKGQQFIYWARCNENGQINDDLLELDVTLD